MARVVVKQGELAGKEEILPSGNTFASFRGIPYATPPVGKLRFKAPLPPQKWTGVRDATQHGAVCPQVDLLLDQEMEGSDDCLFLNVYTPNTKDSLKPVMFWIHGGGFFSGSGNSEIYGPEYFMEEGDVILVTINYRLEVLGFLCLDTPEVPGNAGLKDQVAALRWVKENISAFGGDPNNITVFGESAGGVSVTYHMVSPMSKGLASKLITQSGSFLNEWALTDRKKSRDRAFTLGKLLGKTTNDVNELLEFLQSVPAFKLANVTKSTMSDYEKLRGETLQFVPNVERVFDGQECFLPKSGKELLEDGHVESLPILIGYNNREGLFFLNKTLNNAKKLNSNFELKVPIRIVDKVSKKQLKEIGAVAKKFYFGNNDLCSDTSSSIIDLETDYNFFLGIVEFTKKLLVQSSSVPLYFYRFSVSSELNVLKMNLGLEQFDGACHADDLFYMFKVPMEPQEGSEAWITIKKMIRLWTNFAKYGNPTPKTDDLIDVIWKPVTKNQFNFMNIGTDLVLGEDPDMNRYNFWMNIINSLERNNALKSSL